MGNLYQAVYYSADKATYINGMRGISHESSSEGDMCGQRERDREKERGREAVRRLRHGGGLEGSQHKAGL